MRTRRCLFTAAVTLAIGGSGCANANASASASAQRRPLTASPLSDTPTCKDKTTVFTKEKSFEFRNRGKNFDRADKAAMILNRESAPEGLCHMSDGAHWQEDKAQALVAADLLSGARSAVINGLRRQIEETNKLEACLGPSAGSSCNGSREVLDRLRADTRSMRASLAISKLKPQCISASPRAGEAEIYAAIRRCVSGVKLEHEQPLLAYDSGTFAGELQPLSAAEVDQISGYIAGEIEKHRKANPRQRTNLADSRPWWNHWEAQQKAAKQKYQLTVSEQPLVRFMKGPDLGDGEVKGALAQARVALNSGIENAKKRPIREFALVHGALLAAINKAPTGLAGDYCEVANHLLEENATLELGRDVILTGAMMALGAGPWSLLGRGLVGAAIGSTVATGQWVNGTGEYAERMEQCLASKLCTQQDLESAQSLASLDVMQLGGFGAGVGARAVSTIIAKNPLLRARYMRATAAERGDFDEKLKKAAENQCR